MLLKNFLFGFFFNFLPQKKYIKSLNYQADIAKLRHDIKNAYNKMLNKII